ncbi:tetratricopeptide repeat protein [Luteibacter aegosomatissinici]|uniref:tetratricopeptide repeat protein n=1 Tax=Luteibacter aegosomatissinici TaxID=2911539 RepID=UPI001FF70DFD|nr:hypothetical protein [Luteibacter aegosomatissinici]UPG92844.1 hypothetical protein L2Y97_13315 [Luteibacter aegosomatissinici]
MAAWLAKALDLYPADERFHLAVESLLSPGVTAERLAVLTRAFAEVPSARVACRLAMAHSDAGDHASAAAFFATAEEWECNDSGEETVIATIRTLRVGQLIRAGDGQGALALAKAIDAVGHDTLAGPRARLAAACATGDAALVSTHGKVFIAVLEDNPGIPEDEMLWNEVTFLNGPHWTSGEYSLDAPDLLAHRNVLLHADDNTVRALMQYLFAERDSRVADPDEEGSTDWPAVAAVLGDAATRVSVPRIRLFDASVRLRLKGAKWRVVGRQWMEAKIAVAETESSDAAPGIDGYLVANIRRASTFLKGVVDGLRAAAPAPHAFDALSEGLDELRMHAWVATEMADIMALVGTTDLRPRAQFALGYALAARREAAGALTAYLRVLDTEPDHVTAIFNPLLLCRSPAEADALRRLCGFVDGLGADSVTDEWRGKVSSALERALKACVPAEVPGSPMALMLADFPRLRSDVPTPEAVPLRGVIALIALVRSAPPDVDLLLLRPFPMGTTVFSPTRASRHLSFDAMRTGLVTVGEPTPAEAVSATGEQWSITPDSMWWRLSPAAFAFIEEARSLGSVGAWPDAWQRVAPGLARMIAADECMQYVEYLCEERRWPLPSGKEKLQTLLNDIIARYSVAQAYYLFYIAVMAASDRKETQGLTGQHASNLLVYIAADRFERAKTGKYGEVPPGSWRKHTYPRSALSLALWSDLLDAGDAGFEQQVDDALGLTEPG